MSCKVSVVNSSGVVEVKVDGKVVVLLNGWMNSKGFLYRNKEIVGYVNWDVVRDVRGNVRMKCKDGCMYLMKDKKYMVSFECDMLDVDNKRLKLRGLSVGKIYGLL